MPKGRIEQYDIISKEALASIDLLGKGLSMNLDLMDKLIAKSKLIGGKTTGSDAQISKDLKDQIANYRELDEAKKKINGTNENLIKVQGDLIKINLQEQQASKDLTDKMKAQSIIEDKEAGYLRQLAAENKKLRIERDQLTKSDVDRIAKTAELNAKMEQNNAIIKANSNAMEQQRMNIGNYRSALEGLPGPLGAIFSKLGGFIDMLDRFPSSSKKMASGLDGLTSSAADMSSVTNAAGAATTAMATEIETVIPATVAADAGLLGMGAAAVEEAGAAGVAAGATGVLNKELKTIPAAAGAATAGVVEITVAEEAQIPVAGAAAGATGLFRKALDTVAKHPIILTISLIVGGLALLFKSFQSTQEGAEKTAVLMAKLKAVLDVYINAVKQLVLGWADIFSGKFAQGAEHFKEIFTNVAGKLKDAVKNAGDLATVLQEVKAEKLAARIEDVQLKISKLKIDMSNVELTPTVRKESAAEALRLMKELSDQQIGWANRTAKAEVTNTASVYKFNREKLQEYTLATESERKKLAAGDSEFAIMKQTIKVEEFNRLRNLLDEETKIETDYNTESRRVQNTMHKQGLAEAKEATAKIKQDYEDRKKAAVDAELATISQINGLRDADLSKLAVEYGKGIMSKELYDSKVLEITKKSGEELIKQEIENLKKLDKFDTAGQRAEKDAKIKADQLKLDLSAAEEAAKERVKIEEAAISSIEQLRNEDLDLLAKKFKEGTLTDQQYADAKVKVNAACDDLILRHHLETIQKLLADSELEPLQRVELEKQAAKALKDINDGIAKDKISSEQMWDEEYKKLMDGEYEDWKTVNEKKKKDTKDAEEDKKKIKEASFNLAKEAGNAIFEINNNNIEAEIAAIEKKRDAEIKAAGDNKAAQLAINAKYDKQVAAEKTKQAKNDRLAALFSIAINTAVGITKALDMLPPASYILAGITATLGLIQAGVVLSKKIPEFYKGTQSAPGGAALVGEQGTEVMVTPRKEIRFTPDKATIMNLEPGTKVFTAKETIRLIEKGLQNASGNKETVRESNKETIQRIEREVNNSFIHDTFGAVEFHTREVNRSIPELRMMPNFTVPKPVVINPIVNVDMDPVIQAIKNKRENIFVFKDDGIDISQREGNFYKNYKNHFKL